MQMNEDRIQMSAAGVFKVGVQLIPAVNFTNCYRNLIQILTSISQFYLVCYSWWVP
jgi:hypothetical protein